uniref:Uncharacterized protein n=1 Tax=Meloidogyne incognita TaxID=6306 RepID=A0A914KQA8_MELIC
MILIVEGFVTKTTRSVTVKLESNQVQNHSNHSSLNHSSRHSLFFKTEEEFILYRMDQRLSGEILFRF